jgi:hypothetical protein
MNQDRFIWDCLTSRGSPSRSPRLSLCMCSHSGQEESGFSVICGDISKLRALLLISLPLHYHFPENLKGFHPWVHCTVRIRAQPCSGQSDPVSSREKRIRLCTSETFLSPLTVKICMIYSAVMVQSVRSASVLPRRLLRLLTSFTRTSLMAKQPKTTSTDTQWVALFYRSPSQARQNGAAPFRIITTSRF